MKRFAIYCLFATAALSYAGCSQDSTEVGVPDGDAIRFSITVSDSGYSPDRTATRASENEYATEFSAGDRAGLYVIAADGSVQQSNVEITAVSDGKGGIAWNLPVGTTIWHDKGMRYFLYYPYRADMTGMVATMVPGTTEAEGFFAQLIESWQPSADQSDYASYTASDLMVAEASLGAVSEHVVPLDFPMTHCMALVVVEIPGDLYYITSYNSGKTPCDIGIFIGEKPVFGGDRVPCNMQYRSRFIVRPGEELVLSGSYDDTDTQMHHDFSSKVEAADLVAGSYYRIRVDGGIAERTGDYHELGLVRIGDLFCPTTDNSDWYLVPHEVEKLANGDNAVGVVFQTDKRRFGIAEAEKLGGRNRMHGLVMAVKNVGIEVWGPFNTDEGLTKTQTKAQNYNDISGYYNCEHIRDKYGNFDNYPAFKAADNYNTTCPVPTTTTGWYLPASGQWWDILQNLGGCPALALPDEQISSSTNIKWLDQGNIPAAIDKWMTNIADENKTTFAGSWYWSSSESSGYSDYGDAQHWYISKDNLYCDPYRKDIPFFVLPVLAF